MEDLKQIQEFFLNENVFVEAFKLEKALKGMGYNVKVKALDDFGKNVFEIYFNNPADADDDSIFYDAKKLGYDNVRVFANPQESVSEVDRYSGFNRNPEDPDSEKFEPTGSVAEFKEDLRALFGKFKGDLKNPEFIKGVAQIMVNWKALLRSQLEESTKPDSLKSLLDKYDLDMGWYKKHLIGIDNLSPEEESDLEYVEDRIKSHLSVSEADLNDPVAMKMRAAKMKADKLAKLRAANAGDDGNDKFFEKSTARLRKLKALKDKRAQIMSDMEQEAEIEGGAVADKYGDMLNKLDKAISMLGEAVNDPRIDNSKFGPSPRKFAELRAQMGDEALLDKIQMMDVNILVDVLDELSLMQESTIVNEYDVSIPSQEEVDQFFQDNITLGTHYLNRKPVMGQKGSFNRTEIAPWDEADYSNWKTLVAKSLKEVQKGHNEKVSKEVFSKLKDKTISYQGEDYKVVSSDDTILKIQDSDGKLKSINFNQFNVDGLIREIMETIELGKQLEEGELCPKGEAYRKRRMAAGEKSSAYLSGRAVKVCKGQMSGKKKK